MYKSGWVEGLAIELYLEMGIIKIYTWSFKGRTLVTLVCRQFAVFCCTRIFWQSKTDSNYG